MWIFLNDAFLSTVADRNDSDSLLVRGRFSADIEQIFPDAEVVETSNATTAFVPLCSVTRFRG